jgi:uncharacterized protein Yka (UPF0111/DUF47 family)
MAKTNPYFEDFIKMIELSCRAAEHLKNSLEDFHPETLSGQRAYMHDIEHEEDEVRHEMLHRLVREFVTPIDREDIIALANELDDVTDKIEEILIRLYMYNVKYVRPAALQFADVIVSCARELKQAMIEFPNFHKSSTLRNAIIAVNTMEEKGDQIYVDAVRELHEGGVDPVEVAVWSELFDRLEDCCDVCEHVANTMEVIVMKNS